MIAARLPASFRMAAKRMAHSIGRASGILMYHRVANESPRSVVAMR